MASEFAQEKSTCYEPSAINFHLGETPPRELWEREQTQSGACADSTSPNYALRPAASFAHGRIGAAEHAHHDPARAHQQHAAVPHRVAIVAGLRHPGRDLVGHPPQLDPPRQLGPDIRRESRSRLML